MRQWRWCRTGRPTAPPSDLTREASTSAMVHGFLMKIGPTTLQWRGDLSYVDLDRGQMAEKGSNVVVPRLGDNAIKGVLRCSSGQGDKRCSTRVLGQSSLTWWWSSGSSASTSWRQRQGKGGGLVLFVDKMIVGGSIWGKTSGVLRKDSSTKFIYNPFLPSLIFIRN
jgi:hypothetical protein